MPPRKRKAAPALASLAEEEPTPEAAQQGAPISPGGPEAHGDASTADASLIEEALLDKLQPLVTEALQRTASLREEGMAELRMLYTKQHLKMKPSDFLGLTAKQGQASDMSTALQRFYAIALEHEQATRALATADGVPHSTYATHAADADHEQTDEAPTAAAAMELRQSDGVLATVNDMPHAAHAAVSAQASDTCLAPATEQLPATEPVVPATRTSRRTAARTQQPCPSQANQLLASSQQAIGTAAQGQQAEVCSAAAPAPATRARGRTTASRTEGREQGDGCSVPASIPVPATRGRARTTASRTTQPVPAALAPITSASIAAPPATAASSPSGRSPARTNVALQPPMATTSGTSHVSPKPHLQVPTTWCQQSTVPLPAEAASHPCTGALLEPGIAGSPPSQALAHPSVAAPPADVPATRGPATRARSRTTIARTIQIAVPPPARSSKAVPQAPAPIPAPVPVVLVPVPARSVQATTLTSIPVQQVPPLTMAVAPSLQPTVPATRTSRRTAARTAPPQQPAASQQQPLPPQPNPDLAAVVKVAPAKRARAGARGAVAGQGAGYPAAAEQGAGSQMLADQGAIFHSTGQGRGLGLSADQGAGSCCEEHGAGPRDIHDVQEPGQPAASALAAQEVKSEHTPQRPPLQPLSQAQVQADSNKQRVLHSTPGVTKADQVMAANPVAALESLLFAGVSIMAKKGAGRPPRTQAAGVARAPTGLASGSGSGDAAGKETVSAGLLFQLADGRQLEVGSGQAAEFQPVLDQLNLLLNKFMPKPSASATPAPTG